MKLSSLLTSALMAAPLAGGIAQADALPAMAWGDGSGRTAWTAALLDEMRHAPAVGLSAPGLTVNDIAEFCPNYGGKSAENREAFWAGLLSFMATYETSGFNTANDTREKDGTVSSGLLQLTVKSDQKTCPFLTRATIHDPEVNLRCGARILAHYVVRDRQISAGFDYNSARGAARYWGPMRDGGKRSATAAWTRRQSYCQASAR